MTVVPVLETPRLILREHRLSDFDALHAMRQDPEVYRYITNEPQAPEVTWRKLLSSRGHWDLLGYGYWLVADKATGEVLGEMGFGDFHRSAASIPSGPEIGWALKSSVHGRGLASEGIGAIGPWGDAHLPENSTWCMIVPDHAASLRLAAKAGYRETQRTVYEGDEVVILERPRGGARA